MTMLYTRQSIDTVFLEVAFYIQENDIDFFGLNSISSHDSFCSALASQRIIE